MEYLIWAVFLPGTLWVMGWPVMMAMGWGLYTYLQLIALSNLYDVWQQKKSFADWATFPFRRAMVGFTYWSIAQFMSLVPGLGIVTSIFFGWAAVIDYYDYVYVLSPWLD